MEKVRPWKLIVAHTTAAVLLMMAAVSPVAAAPRLEETLPLDLESALATFRTLGPAAAAPWIEAALARPEASDFAASLAEDFRGALALQPAAARVVSGGGLVGVFVPIAGGAGYSNLQLWLDEATGQLLSTLDYLFLERSDGSIDATFHQDGKLRFRAVLSEAGEVLAGTAFTLGGEVLDLAGFAAGEDFACLNDCLAGMGVANWIIAAIALACAIACAVTIGVGCVACIAALGFGLGAELGVCVERCR